MRKMKLFLLFLMFFLSFPVFAQTESRDTADTKLPRTIEEFSAQNPVAGELKSDDYWDLVWHAKMADYGDKQSQFILAEAYEFGRHTEPNPKKALAFYKKSAQQGHIGACMRLGYIYSENKWIQEDIDQSLFWFEQAAKQGYAPAQLKLSDLYEHGKKKDYTQSYYWLGMATKQSFPKAVDLENKAPHLKKLADYLTPQEYEEVLKRLEE